MTNSSARPRRDGARSLLVMALASVSALALTGPASAQSVDQASRAATAERDFDIPAQALSSALLRFAEQSDLQILFSQEDVAGMTSRPVRGRLTPEAALAQLLPQGAPRIEIAGDRVVRTDLPRPQYADNESGEEIVVTGTRIRGATPAGSNVLSLDRDDVEATGRSTVQDILATLPQNFPGAQGEATQLGASDSRRNISFGSTVDLRGLGADATLTLVNGRRLAPAGYGNFIDVSAIPVSAISRIEILADGASATYGADAVGGVVNVILRTDFEGAETALRYGGATQGGPEDVGFSQLLGTSWASGSVVFGYEYRHRSDLAAADRWFTSNSDLRPWGGTNFSGTSANPGNITRIGPTSVVLAIPEGQDGTSLSQADLLPGVRNFQNTTEGNSLLPDQESHSAFAAAHQEFGDLTISAEMLASERRGLAYRFQNNANLTVPETNYYRQLNGLFPGQGNLVISYNLGADLGPTWLDTEARALNTMLSAAYELPADWRIEGTLGYARHEDDSTQGNVYDSGALNAALASSNIATAFNPFADGSNSAPGVLEGLTYQQLISSETNISTFGLKADGRLFALWGGDLRAGFGAERRREEFDFVSLQRRISGDTLSVPFAPGDRTTDALFAELFAPIIGAENGVPFVHELSLSLSLRHEAPSDFDATTVPKIGVHWALTDALALRGTWGESFKAPQFQQMLGSTGGTISVAPPALDPFATNGSTGILLLAGSNPNLEPEQAESWTAGFDYRPTWLRGFELHGTYFDIDFANRIGNAGSVLAALANPAGFESVFIRNPTQAQIDTYLSYADAVAGVIPPDGIEVIWDGRLTNLATLRMRGVDLNATFGHETAFGSLQWFASASILLQNERRTTAAAAPLDVLDTIFNPVDWRARAGVSWSNENWSALAAVNYMDDSRDNISSPNREINESITWDARLAHAWRSDDGHGVQLALNVQNLFDEDPPFANNPIGYAYDTQNGSPIGRFISIELRRTW
jgi:outer membrane cobalamin receptor